MLTSAVPRDALLQAHCGSDESGPIRSLEIGILDLAPGRIRYGTTQPSLPSAPHRQGAQISPGRCANCRCTSAEFTVGCVPVGLAATCHLPPAACHLPSPTASLGLDWAVCSSSPRTSCTPALLHSCTPALLHSGILRTIPRGFALPFGSWLFLLSLSPSRYSHRGLPPQKLSPMLGAHPSLNRTPIGAA